MEDRDGFTKLEKKKMLLTLLANERGGAHDNPNVEQFCQNTQALRVINSFCKGPVKGNCRRKGEPISLEDENKPLPKRKCAHR